MTDDALLVVVMSGTTRARTAAPEGARRLGDVTQSGTRALQQ
jgi:hypothetical protein